ncbi:MAG: hypothetical protein WCS69_16720 [Ignavibacteriaceae bacterium]|jgi:hypothetical protein
MEPENNKFSIILDTIRHRFDTVKDADNVLDQKSGTLMGFTIAIIVGYLAIIPPQLAGSKLYEGVAGIIFLLISTLLLIIISWPRDYSFASVKVSSNQEYLNKEEKQLLLQLISDNESATDKNYRKLKIKAILFKVSVVVLVLGSLLLILSKLSQFYV